MEVSMTVDDNGWGLIGCELGGFERLRCRGLRHALACEHDKARASLELV
jgi:hypothetical protein